MESNAQKMREALDEIVNHHCRNCPEDTQYGCGVNIEGLLGFKCTLLKQARVALAAPPRNCDVGTAEEQMKRFREFCETEKCGRYRCRSGCKATCIDRCAVAWSQMPYEEGARKEESSDRVS